MIDKVDPIRRPHHAGIGRQPQGAGRDEQAISKENTFSGTIVILPPEQDGHCFGRLPQEVLNIVYCDLAEHTKLGGFFLNGVNGFVRHSLTCPLSPVNHQRLPVGNRPNPTQSRKMNKRQFPGSAEVGPNVALWVVVAAKCLGPLPFH
jgi:hypothetical protein